MTYILGNFVLYMIQPWIQTDIMNKDGEIMLQLCFEIWRFNRVSHLSEWLMHGDQTRKEIRHAWRPDTHRDTCVKRHTHIWKTRCERHKLRERESERHIEIKAFLHAFHTSFATDKPVSTHLIIFIMQHPATHRNTLQHTATHCNTLQHTATHCNTFHFTFLSRPRDMF